MMRKYASIEVVKSSENTKETIDYYILEEEKFGIRISKNDDNNNSNKDEIIIHNISSDKSTVENLVDTLLKTNNDISQFSYIIEDYLHKDHSIV